MDIPALHKIFLSHKIISTDSRNILPGCLFFALKGENFNGNRFALQAVEKGASFAIVDEDMEKASEKCIRVNDVLTTLQQLATCHRKHLGLTILAITGSNGKTTTKELCRQVLEKKFRVLATTGNLNNHIGVPLTLLSLTEDIQLGIVEMGANHPGEIAALCNIAQPDLGLITNIGKAHLEGFGGIQGVARAKGELFRFLMEHNKTVLVNDGNPYLHEMIPSDYPNVVRYNSPSALYAASVSANPFLSMKVKFQGGLFDVTSNLVGSYNVENILAAITAGLQFGISPSEISNAIASYTPQNNRSQLIKTGKNLVFMDAYNANPSSMMAAIGEFLQMEGQRKIWIIGEMREVGNSSQSEHQEILAFLKSHHVSDVRCVGIAFETIAEKEGFRYYPSVEALTDHLKQEKPEGTLIFVKGSRSNRLEKVIPLL